MQEIALEIQAYLNFHEEIIVENQLLIRRTRIVIYVNQRHALLKQLNAGYLGLSKVFHIGSKTIYWPGMYDQRHELVTNCHKLSNSYHKQSPSKQLGQKVPLIPWSKLAMHIFHFEKSSYLIKVYYYCRLQVICKLDRITAIHVTSHMQDVCLQSMDGLISDNGPY